MEVNTLVENSVYSRIVKMVEHAQNTKAPIQSLADRVSAIFVPIIMCLSVLSIICWLIVGESIVFAFNIFISVLILLIFNYNLY